MTLHQLINSAYLTDRVRSPDQVGSADEVRSPDHVISTDEFKSPDQVISADQKMEIYPIKCQSY